MCRFEAAERCYWLTRRRRDLNPGRGFTPLNALAVRSLRPLGHASSRNSGSMIEPPDCRAGRKKSLGGRGVDVDRGQLLPLERSPLDFVVALETLEADVVDHR